MNDKMISDFEPPIDTLTKQTEFSGVYDAGAAARNSVNPSVFTCLVTTDKRAGLAEFLNALRIMQGIDQHELQDAGLSMDTARYLLFCQNPYRWMMRASDDDAAKVWGVIQARQPKR